MKTKMLLALLLLLIMSASVIMPVFSTDSLYGTDFLSESWSKIIDYFDYTRAFATLHGLEGPPADYHANVYMTYVNESGLQMLYAGMCNMTFDDEKYLTIPMQTLMLHYKTENDSRDALFDSNFLMLLAFNDSATSLYPDSPDVNDNLWSSFSMGFNFSNAFPSASFPSQATQTELFPLTNSSNGLQWSWGMRYKDLTAVWWRTWISPSNHTYQSWPYALTTYDELTFNYTLTISPDTHRATITETHAIGRIRDLWLFWGWLGVPLFNHYNSTGTYLYNDKISNQTIYGFLKNNQIKMSIVDYQKSLVLDHDTYSTTNNGQNVTDNENLVSNSSISTYTDDGEKIFDTSFGAKEPYKLYNYTADPSEQIFDTYNSTARTSKIDGFSDDNDLLVFQVSFMKFLPWLVYDMHPQLYDKAKENIGNMAKADYLYLVAYPVYSGYRIEQDPVFTAYISVTPIPEFPTAALLPLFIIASVTAILYAKKNGRTKKQTLLP